MAKKSGITLRSAAARRVLRFSSAAVIVSCALAACSSGSSSSGNEPSEKASETTSTPASAPTSSAASAPADPDLAAGLAFAKEQMPGVDEALLEQAKKEGSLTYYVGTFTQSTDSMLAGFKKLFPYITVRTYSAADSALRQKFTSEEDAGHHSADVITSTDPGQLNKLAAGNYFMNYSISNEAKYPKAQSDPGYWYPLRISSVGIAWNSDDVSAADAQILNSWQGITDPRWKGKAGIIDPAAGGLSLLPIYAWEQLYGDSFLKAVAANAPRIYSSATPAADALASGEISVLFTGNETQLNDLYNKGAPIEWADPDPAIGAVTGQAISANAPHPAAAKLFQEYTFSLEGATLWSKFSGLPVREGLDDQRKVASEPWFKAPTKFFDYDPAEVTKGQAAALQEFSAAFGK